MVLPLVSEAAVVDPLRLLLVAPVGVVELPQAVVVVVVLATASHLALAAQAATASAV
jgi:hypothetical protein